ncbi:hypothetical protein YPPY66_3746 [Yersinia pestis PY-66]|uniref:Uncharacterized protein n=1 Tax=Yersinia pestis PY-08 TaxID=992134 RepID=A0AB72ZGA4_YERPE|nr:hypothetical protein YPPY02_3430 [Yersinia pestis PY-02]EIQ87258.1 hypothetical protein YPPY03_3496 [Yersinia pestis PY-03]EIQ99533.1 hypothetical protein YPPY04_3442 [Yersinia pestis PY-04]EIR00548.1 hypothetical protein YPPY05_3420 [Yersinia pestis PY-05]EIR04033.1 hypothetical protein YPPY06_3480 [Yersinia pestis PY-06]EIR15637.1 hypothetical protein YPPY08_3474 [Yersinia pestis PY-08]EIR17604.1 hypothetical protein YPPY09_3486 [Yersinia pestis PY-09]EIR30631.1 hypothetical protein YPP
MRIDPDNPFDIFNIISFLPPQITGILCLDFTLCFSLGFGLL